MLETIILFQAGFVISKLQVRDEAHKVIAI